MSITPSFIAFSIEKKDYTVKYTELGGRINVTMQLKWNCFETACRLMKYIGDRMTMSSHCHCLLIVIALNNLRLSYLYIKFIEIKYVLCKHMAYIYY